MLFPPNPVPAAVTPFVRKLSVLACSALLPLLACSSVSRSTTAAGPWWEGTDGAAPVATVTPDTTGAKTDSGGPTVDVTVVESVKPESPVVRPMEDSLSVLSSLSPEALASRRTAYAKRTRAERDRVRQVNEYAFWCLGRDMWDEARLHLERAVQIDSLAASLHNNLGIVYERMGRRDQARVRYGMAAGLNPDRPLYEANLSRMRAALEQPRPIPSDSLAAEELMLRPPRGDRRPDLGVVPKRTEGEVRRELP